MFYSCRLHENLILGNVQADGAEGGPAEGQGTTGGTRPELSELTEMVQVMVEDEEH